MRTDVAPAEFARIEKAELAGAPSELRSIEDKYRQWGGRGNPFGEVLGRRPAFQNNHVLGQIPRLESASHLDTEGVVAAEIRADRYNSNGRDQAGMELALEFGVTVAGAGLSRWKLS